MQLSWASSLFQVPLGLQDRERGGQGGGPVGWGQRGRRESERFGRVAGAAASWPSWRAKHSCPASSPGGGHVGAGGVDEGAPGCGGAIGSGLIVEVANRAGGALHVADVGCLGFRRWGGVGDTRVAVSRCHGEAAKQQRQGQQQRITAVGRSRGRHAPGCRGGRAGRTGRQRWAGSSSSSCRTGGRGGAGQSTSLYSKARRVCALTSILFAAIAPTLRVLPLLICPFQLPTLGGGAGAEHEHAPTCPQPAQLAERAGASTPTHPPLASAVPSPERAGVRDVVLARGTFNIHVRTRAAAGGRARGEGGGQQPPWAIWGTSRGTPGRLPCPVGACLASDTCAQVPM